MNHKLILSAWAAALAVSVVTTLSTSEANQTPQSQAILASTQSPSQAVIAQEPQDSQDIEALPSPSDSSAAELIKVGESKSEADLSEDKAAIAKIHTHQHQGRPAATVYVRNIPVATFLGSKDKSSSTEAVKVADQQSSSNQADSQDPVWRATTVAATINQLHRDGTKADSIRVSWDATRKTYVIKTANTQLLEMSKLTMLPDTTQDEAEDALQITNRLRRQLGNAAPLKTIPGRPQPKPQPVVAAVSSSSGYQFSGEASWYGPGFHGNYTANGERFNQYGLTAAHKTLPFGTQVKVTNLYNGRSVVVRINDRGPFTPGRVIDLSQGAAQAIGVINSGVAPVKVDVLK
ncbi:MAG: septal ring lytic transglycosylase RlpA family protein [Acaryochloridaceae cyanobacterium SU_2_1]|nr:septal ring lytic transglycosylase RlpA family protein [Acaryochloridaceae cyanobacterium SU_2_1]